MYLGYQNDKIKFYTEQPLDKVLYNLDQIVETDQEYIKEGDQYILKPADYDEQQLILAKIAKHDENNEKAEIARENQFFTVTIDDKDCTFQTTRRTQQDLMTAKDFIQITEQPYQWFSDNNEEVYLTLEDVVTISTIFIQKANVYPIWSVYETQIEQAETIEEVNAIVINYDLDQEELEALLNVEQEVEEEPAEEE